MSAQDTVRMLREGLVIDDPAHWRRIQARVAWVRETIAALTDANDRVFAAWQRIFESLPDDIDDEELEAMHIPDPPEQAEVDAIHAELDAALERDEWPAHLYFGGI